MCEYTLYRYARWFYHFKLDTRSAKKVSVKEGLVNGANVILAEAGDDLWVGTFKGLSLYNIKTGKIQNFTDQQLVGGGFNVDVEKILVTPNAVYVNSTAHEGNPGGLAGCFSV